MQRCELVQSSMTNRGMRMTMEVVYKTIRRLVVVLLVRINRMSEWKVMF